MCVHGLEEKDTLSLSPAEVRVNVLVNFSLNLSVTPETVTLIPFICLVRIWGYNVEKDGLE